MNSGTAILEIFQKLEKNELTHFEAFAAIERIKHQQKEERKENQKKKGLSIDRNVLTRVFKYDEPYLREHVIFGQQVVLGVTNCSLAIEAAKEMPWIYPGDKSSPIHIHKFIFHQPMVVSPGEIVEVSVHAQGVEGEKSLHFENRFKKFPGSGSGITTSGQFLLEPDFPGGYVDINRFLHGYDRYIPGEAFFKKRLLICPPCFKVVEQAYVQGDEVLGEMRVTPEVKNNTFQYLAHPALLNGGFIIGVCNQPDNILLENDPGAMWIPFMIKDVYIQEPLTEHSYCHARIVQVNSSVLVMDFCFCDENGKVKAAFKDFVFRYTKPQQFLREETRTQVKTNTPSYPEKKEMPVQAEKNITSMSSHIETYITDKVANLLGKSIDKKSVKRNKNFMDLGIDSNTLILLAQQMEKELKVELYPTLFFEYQDIDQLTKYFHDNHKEAFTGFFSAAESINERKENSQGEGALARMEIIRGEPGAPVEIPDAQDIFEVPGTPQTPGVPEITRVTEVTGATCAPADINREDIAIIGMAGRFAMSPTLAAFWENLKAGKDLVQEIPPGRWDWRSWFSPDREAHDRTYCKWGSFIEVDKFDPLFFGINPREAVWLDPQLRLLLEVNHAAIEDAGYGSKIHGTNTGVFVGVGLREYWEEILRAHIPFVDYQANSSLLFNLSGRISFTYDLHGPSFPVDTACSSSLTSLHLACRALRGNECDMALVSGTNLLLSHLHYVYVSRMQALSPTGRCHTFDKDADGYVPGEGVGTLLLKLLSRAVRDNDNIHAIIKGTAVNHVGKSNNPTAPRPELQEKVVLDAWKDAAVKPDTITYIEAHGTGTKLGDPIEINALKKAFGRFTTRTGFCALGTAKSHIGHLGASAGIAGTIKTVLSMKHKQIPVMPTFKELNPYIVLENSPFYINKKLQAWEPGKGVPRRAGISSFGIGGTNAHVVMEEYIPPLSQSTPASLPAVSLKTPMLFVLSAMDETRLKAYAREMVEFLGTKTPPPSLSDVVYSLQVGRQPMEERLAMVVSNPEELIEKLYQFSQGNASSGIKNVYKGSITTQPGTAGLSNEIGDDRIRSLIHDGDIHGLAKHWIHGVNIDWTLLYHDNHGLPRIISLPTYPFARERYWIPLKSQDDKKSAQESVLVLHPLLDRQENTYNSPQTVVFKKTLRKTEPVVRDHQVQNQCTLPGVGYLEMASAGFLATDSQDGLVSPDQNKNLARSNVDRSSFIPFKFARVVWQQPLVVRENEIDVRVVLEKENNHLVYKIQSKQEDRQILHAQGEIHVTNPLSHQGISIETIKARCLYHFDKETLYQGFKKMELSYGAYFQGLSQVWAGKDEALGQLCLPPAYEDEFSQYTLHPSLMDSALQTIAGLVMNPENPDLSPGMPFAVKEVEILSPLHTRGYAYAARAGDQQYDVTILDEEGNVAVIFHHLAVRKLPERFKHFFFAPRWKLEPTTSIPDGLPGQATEHRQPMGKKVVLLVYPTAGSGIGEALARSHPDDEVFKIRLGVKNQKLAEDHWEINAYDPDALSQCLGRFNPPQIIYFLGGLQPEEVEFRDLDALAWSQECGVFSMFRLIKALDIKGFLQTKLHLVVITNDVNQVRPGDIIRPFSASLVGLCKTANKEYSQTWIQCVDISLAEEGITSDSSPEILDKLIRTAISICSRKQSEEIVVRNGRCFVRTIEPILIPETSRVPFKRQGTYFILGGAGGIGLELSLFLARIVQANLVLVEQRLLTPEQEEKIAFIESCGGKVLYIQADASNLESMEAAVKKAKSRFGRINGVIHSALVLEDKLLHNMEEETLRAVLTPKVAGSVVLSNVLAGEPLDFMLFFSSAQSFACSAGQGNYAAACTFKDAFAWYLDRCEPYPVKIINWGYWGSVGVVASKQYQQRTVARGAGSIEPEEGMDAIKRILVHQLNQVVCLKAVDHLLEKIGIDLQNYQTLYPEQIPAVLAATLSNLKPPSLDLNNLQMFQSGYEEMNRFIPQWLLQVFQRKGVFQQNDQLYYKDELKQQLGILPNYERLFYAALEILENAGFIQCRDREVITLAVPDKPELYQRKDTNVMEEQKEGLIKKFPGIKDHVHLLLTCLTALPDILNGGKHYTEVMFPGGSKSLVENVYHGTPVTDYFNHWAAQVIKQYLQQRLKHDPGAVIHILEVGAGTGSTSGFVINGAAEYGKHIKYWYTDISLGFTQHGRKVYGADYPFLEFQVLDIEQAIEGQGFEPGSIDLLLASNVLHATKEMNHTLMNAKKLLKSNGLLVVIEAATVQDLGTLTFGLTEGWWCFEDVDIRLPRSPFLDALQWKNLLENNGIRQVHVFGLPGTPVEKSPQCMILGESNGIVIEVGQEDHKIIPQEKLTENNPGIPAQSIETLSGNMWSEITIEYIKTVFSDILNIPKARLDQASTFERYGVDSLVSMEIIQRFEKDFGKLSSTLLFEHMTIEKLKDYFISQHLQQLKEMFTSKGQVPVVNTLGREIIQKKEAGQYLGKENEIRGSGEIDKGSYHSYQPQSLKIPGIERTGREEKQEEPGIAIIGLSGRYPMAETVDEFWENLLNGKNCISEIPRDRWDREEHLDRCGSRWGGFIHDADKFDSYFFHISPREAENMDPQERLFLETTWAVFEDAGYTRSHLARLNNDIGIFVGVMNSNYEFISGEAYARGQITGARSSYSSIANRVSYFFDFQGPSLAVDTACSSALTALHLACESLKREECQLAIAGGVNLVLHPVHFQRLKGLKMITADNHCKPFAEGADGFVDGEGVGAVLLKPLDQAIADQDHIYAVIKGTRINVGGKTSGYGVPNPNAQTRLISTALQRAKINPRTITYIEAQGTSTALGDSIETSALIKAFQQYSPENQYCSIGSVKSNIGHLESAGGIASLTKVIMQMKHRKLVPSLHSKVLNPGIDFAASPFYVQQELAEWHQPVIIEAGQEKIYPRRAIINSYGAGGANACVILEEPPLEKNNHRSMSTGNAVAQGEVNREAMKADFPTNGNPYLILLSAKNEERLKVYARKLIDFLDHQSDQNSTASIAGNSNNHPLRQKIEQYLLQTVSDILHVQVNEIKPGEDLELYGFDVTNQSELFKRINETYNLDIPPGILTGYSSVEMLSGYLYQVHRDILLHYYDMSCSEDKKEPLSAGGTERRIHLPDIAYTLQMGREAMEERLALPVYTAGELREKLAQYCQANSQEDLEYIYCGHVKRSKVNSVPFINGEEGREFMHRLMNHGKLHELARFWVSAVEVSLDWSRLYANTLPRRISLPAYPFARKRHWIPESCILAGESIHYDQSVQAQLPSSGHSPVPGASLANVATTDTDNPGTDTAMDEGELRQKIREALVKGVSAILKISEEYIDLDQDISEFGFDSITFTEFSEWLNDRHGLDIVPSIFFEHPNLESLARYMGRQYRSNFITSNRISMDKARENLAGKEPGVVNKPEPGDKPVRSSSSQGVAVLPQVTEPIAIVGISGVMPGSKDLDEFWENLAAGKDLVTEVPADRWDWREWYGDPAKDGNKTPVKWGGFMEDVDRFDPLFFGISPHEAEMMDPQQRILMQTVWHTIEDAGYKASDLSGTRMGLFVGVAGMDYSELVKEHSKGYEPQMSTGVSHSVLVNRISYLLNVHGPSEPVDTACSSSLTAVHRAVEAIRSGECDLAAAGGVNVMISPIWNVVFGKSGMLAPDGRCKTFDKKANGYVRGEGCGVVLLKPLSRARADNDHIYAVIKGTSINHGGHATSLTAPNPNAQAELIIRAWEKSGLDPTSVSYIETHGTGTELGDPIEINGLKKAFTRLYQQWGKPVPAKPHCGLGSVKTNIGHLETAAGIAGLIKVLLAMKHQTIPRHLHFCELNPYIQLENTPFTIVTETQPWKRLKDKDNQEIPRRAGISAFGFGGVNCHVVLEEYIQPEAEPRSDSIITEQESHLIILSAKNEKRLKNYAGKMVDFLAKDHETPSLTHMAYTLQNGRDEMEERLAVVVSDKKELQEKLQHYCRGEKEINNPVFYSNRARSESKNEKSATRSKETNASPEVENLIMERQLNQLAHRWISGEKINWQLLYPGKKPDRVSLPTYPFARESYWIARGSKPVHISPPVSVPGPAPVHVPVLKPLPSLVDPVTRQVKSFFETDRVKKERKLFLRSHQALAELEALSQWLVLDVFREMGVMRQAGEQYETLALREQLKIIPSYYPLYEELLDILVQAGFIRIQGDQIIVDLTPGQRKVTKELRRLETKKERIVQTFPEIKSHVRFLLTCINALPRILTGQVDPLEIMFPRGSMELVEPIYKGNNIPDFYNRLAARVVKEYIQLRIQMQPRTQVNILEVGAGTGGTTGFVLDAIAGFRENIKYFYTDISVKFIQHGKKVFAEKYPMMEFNVLDIEKYPSGQNIEPHRMDIVLASNVYHATKTIKNTLLGTNKLLKANGILILNEAVQRQNFATLTFGLTSGWWLFQDRENRIKGSPLVSPGTWEKLMKANGFRQVQFFSLNSIINREPFQNIIIGEYTGETPGQDKNISSSSVIDIEFESQISSTSGMVPGKAAGNILPTQSLLSGDENRVARCIEQVEVSITRTLAQVLEIGESEFDPEIPFQNYGVDSLLAVVIIDRLNEIFDHRLRKTDLFNYSTISTLSQHIVKDLGFRPDEPEPLEPHPGTPSLMNDDAMMELLCQLEQGELEVEYVANLLEECNNEAS